MSYRKQFLISGPLTAEERKDFRYLRWLSPALLFPAILQVARAFGLDVTDRAAVATICLSDMFAGFFGQLYESEGAGF